MSHYEAAPEHYDLLYSAIKNYRAETEVLTSLIRERTPDARTVLDVACGTGEHARWLVADGFEVTGVDLEPAFIDIARAKSPEARFSVADMTSLDLGETFDVVLCLFSAIGYVGTREVLDTTVAALARHVAPGGLLLIDPWFGPGQLTHGFVSTLTAADAEHQVARVCRTVIEGRTSTLEMHYLIGTSAGIEHRSETHVLGLFTQDEMEGAFREAGLGSVERIPEVLRTRGIYIGRRPA